MNAEKNDIIINNVEKNEITIRDAKDAIYLLTKLNERINKIMSQSDTFKQGELLYHITNLQTSAKHGINISVSEAEPDLSIIDARKVIAITKSNVFNLIPRDELKRYGINYVVHRDNGKIDTFMLYPVVDIKEVTEGNIDELVLSNSKGQKTVINKDHFIRAVKILYLLTDDKYYYEKAKQLPMLCGQDTLVVIGHYRYVALIAPMILP